MDWGRVGVGGGWGELEVWCGNWEEGYGDGEGVGGVDEVDWVGIYGGISWRGRVGRFEKVVIVG